MVFIVIISIIAVLILAIILLALIYYFYILISKKVKGVDTSLFDTDYSNMPGYEFEEFVAKILKQDGFTNVKVSKKSGDHGIDIVANKNGILYGIQCKRYKDKVGNGAVQEAYTGAAYYKCDKAMVITNSEFTKAAIDEAKKIGVELWDGDKLKSEISKSKNEYILKYKKPEQVKKKQKKQKPQEKKIQMALECPKCKEISYYDFSTEEQLLKCQNASCGYFFWRNNK